MTEHDQTAGADRANSGRAAPVASLTRISVRRAPHPSPPARLVETACDAPGMPRGQVSAPQIIEVCAEIPEPAHLPARSPARSKVFPSAMARPTETIDAATRHTYVAPAAIIDLWEHLAADRLRPNMSDVDPVTIAGQWPNSLLLRVTEGGRRPGLEVAHMFAPPAGGPTSVIPIDAMTVDWIVGLGREVVITGGPVHETDAVPTGGGPITCGVIALPFGPELAVDHVLCHLYRVDDRVVDVEVDAELNLPPRDRTGIRRLFGR